MQSKSNYIHTIVLGSLDTPPFDKCFESCRRVFSPAGIAPACLTPDQPTAEIKRLKDEIAFLKAEYKAVAGCDIKDAF